LGGAGEGEAAEEGRGRPAGGRGASESRARATYRGRDGRSCGGTCGVPSGARALSRPTVLGGAAAFGAGGGGALGSAGAARAAVARPPARLVPEVARFIVVGVLRLEK